MKAADLHQTTLVPICGHHWAIEAGSCWMVRTDHLDAKIAVRCSASEQVPLRGFAPQGLRQLLSTKDRELVALPMPDPRVNYVKLGTALLSIPVPAKTWEQTRFLIEHLDDQAALLSSPEGEIAAINRHFLTLLGPGEWHAQGKNQPFYRVNEDEVDALVMPIKTSDLTSLPLLAA